MNRLTLAIVGSTLLLLLTAGGLYWLLSNSNTKKEELPTTNKIPESVSLPAEIVPPTSTSPEIEIPFKRLEIKEVEAQQTGAVSSPGPITEQERVFSTETSWRAFWQKYKVSELPSVDFASNSVAAVFLEEKPSSGYSVEIGKITRDSLSGKISIHVIEWLPDPKMGYAGVNVYPADLVVFPVQHGEVEFVRSKKVQTN